MKHLFPLPKSNLATVALLGCIMTSSEGAGFQIAERSVSGLGRAFSGEAAIADDASVLASNPAGIILLDDGALSSGLQYIRPQIDVSGQSASGTTSDTDIGEAAVVPYFYYVRKVNDDLSLGLGLFSSFGLATEYSTSFASLAGTERSEITTLTINPSLAYRINDQWTVGAGFNALYAHGRLTARNTPTDMVPGVVGNRLVDLEGDDWGFGWNIGVLYQPSESTRVGLHYRSSIDLGLEGDITGDLVALTGANRRDGSLDIETPDTVEFSIYHEVNDKWALHFDVLWTNWSKFQEIAPVVHPLIDDSLSVQENWEDAFRYSIGATYKYSETVTLRFGIAYDESPVPSTGERTLRIPDADRLWLSIGATIKLNDSYNLDIGYTHIFANDANIQFEALGGNEGQFQGVASGDVDIIGIGISGTF